MDLSLNIQDINLKNKKKIIKPYEYRNQYNEVPKRKFIRRGRNSNISLDLNTQDIPGASVKHSLLNKVKIKIMKIIES